MPCHNRCCSNYSGARRDLNDPAVWCSYLKLNGVVGVTGVFDSGGGLKSMGIQCALWGRIKFDTALELDGKVSSKVNPEAAEMISSDVLEYFGYSNLP